jgi:hypothetical protein
MMIDGVVGMRSIGKKRKISISQVNKIMHYDVKKREKKLPALLIISRD